MHVVTLAGMGCGRVADRLKIAIRQPPILFRITGVRRRGRAGPVQPRAGHAAVHGWPMLLHGHSCHWYLSKLYKLLLPCTRLCCHVAGTIGWRLLARFQNGATCLGANGALAIRAASCMFGSSPPPLARAGILCKETRFSVVLFHTVGPH